MVDKTVQDNRHFCDSGKLGLQENCVNILESWHKDWESEVKCIREPENSDNLTTVFLPYENCMCSEEQQLESSMQHFFPFDLAFIHTFSLVFLFQLATTYHLSKNWNCLNSVVRCWSYHFSLFFLGIRGQRVFIDTNGDAEVDLTLLDMRWKYTSNLPLIF